MSLLSYHIGKFECTPDLLDCRIEAGSPALFYFAEADIHLPFHRQQKADCQCKFGLLLQLLFAFGLVADFWKPLDVTDVTPIASDKTSGLAGEGSIASISDCSHVF